ncbi:tetratricopeptide repeat protein [Amycolatopsis sp. OK19-0408]|uniref:Tetratricopeptide repeat protein n=1 Tax=Amycolatopsis iheyensis TaxID=2945988 RepID=A0A9X2NGK4_9PSEU|nr:tetratricopeptide repeat protein [Amycolatopsis iheyensis]MCR6488264.1 tetratricopeptide repeat protein [Amycolatopsis iheyensis]
MARSTEDADAAPSRPQPLTAAQQFGAAMRRLRRLKKLTLRALSEKVNYHYSVLSRIELGQLPPTIEAARAIDEALGAGGALVTLAEVARSEPYAALPPPPPLFVGREHALGALSSALIHEVHPDRSTVAFVYGPPGTGKTALARWWANLHQHDFDHVLYADLRGFDPRQPAEAGEILERLLRGLGVSDERIPSQPSMQLDVLRGHLEQRATVEHRVLIVLDNAQDSRQVAQVLPGSRNTSVLITSRRRMSGLVITAGAEAIALQAMTKDDAVELIRGFVGKHRVEAEPAAVARLANLCARLPLALNIAAERVASNDTLTIAQHAELLAHGALELQVADDESIGVRAAYSYSYRQLSDDQARVFRLCGLHPGVQLTADSVAALADTTSAEAFQLMEQLVQLSLMQALPARAFRLHDLLRDYAAEEAARPDRDEEREPAIRRLVHWYLHTVNAASWAITPERPDHHIHLGPAPDAVTPVAFPSFDSAYRWSVRELPNLAGVAELALDHGMLFPAWRIPVECFDFFIHYRPVSAWIDSFEVALKAAELADDYLRVAQAADELAEGYLRRGDPVSLERAFTLAARAIEVCEGHEPPRFMAFAYIEQGEVAFIRGDFELSAQLCEQALAVAQQVGTKVGETLARTHLGSAYRALGRFELAARHGETAFTLLEAADDPHGMGYAAVPLARTLRASGDLERALHYCEQAARAFDRRDDFQGKAEALAERGLTLLALGELEEARTTFDGAQDRLRQINQRVAETYAAEWNQQTAAER